MTVYAKAINATADVLIAPPKTPLTVADRVQRSLFVEIILMRPAVRLLLVGLGLTFAVFGLAVPILQKTAIDGLTLDAPTGGWSPVHLFVFSFVGLAATRAIEFVVKCLGTRESVVVETWLSSALYRKALTLKSKRRHTRTVGEVVALMASHLAMVAFFLTDLFPMFFTSFIPIVAAPFVLAFFFDITPVPVFLLVLTSLFACYAFARRSSRLFQNYKISDEQNQYAEHH